MGFKSSDTYNKSETITSDTNIVEDGFYYVDTTLNSINITIDVDVNNVVIVDSASKFNLRSCVVDLGVLGSLILNTKGTLTTLNRDSQTGLFNSWTSTGAGLL